MTSVAIGIFIFRETGQTAPLLGTGPAAAIGLVQVVTGLVLLAGAALTFSLRSVRRLEAELPDYQAEIAGEK